MQHPLFTYINQFKQWASEHYPLQQDELYGEWEAEYEEWDEIYTSFHSFLAQSQPLQWSKETKDELLYIIARDNDSSILAANLTEEALLVLTDYSLQHGTSHSKWQLVTELHRLSNKQAAAFLVEAMVTDEDEYVSRRALMELTTINSAKVEQYASLFWNRTLFGNNNEYQRMAVLNALNRIESTQLPHYIQLAKEDGRDYLLNLALQLDRE